MKQEGLSLTKLGRTTGEAGIATNSVSLECFDGYFWELVWGYIEN